MLPKRRFWNEWQKRKSGFSKHFSRAWVLDLGYEPLKSYAPQTKILEGRTNISVRVFEALFNVLSPKSCTHILEKCFENYPSQTKILEGLTKEKIQIFEALFKGVITRFGLRTIEQYIENLDFIFCSIFQKFSFGEHKSASKIRISSFVIRSKIFVWEG